MRIIHIQPTLVISTSVISNNRLSRGENLNPILNLTTGNKLLWIRGEIAHNEQFLLFPTYFSTSLTPGVKLHTSFIKFGCSIHCFPRFYKSDMSKYGYLEVFQQCPLTSITRVDCIYIFISQ